MENLYNDERIFKLTPEAFAQLMDRWNIKGQMSTDIETAKNYYEKLQAIKRYYEQSDRYIMDAFRKSKFLWASTYPYDWSRIFTPIEYRAWASIRGKGRIVLYPQYPALNYHLDFANPGLKVALELDGKEFHNKERDIIRDAELKKCGWTVYRVTGAEMSKTNYKELYEIEEEYEYTYDEDKAIEDIRHWLLNTGDGVIHAIKEIHFEEHGCRIINENVKGYYRSYCHQTLENHQY